MKQLIICVETNKKAKTDVGYIDMVIKLIYRINSSIKLQYKFFEGKGNYKSASLQKNIQRDIRALKDRTLSEVVYFVDTDKFDSDPADKKANEEIQRFCKEKGYKHVWFCRDIEEVFLHKTVDDSKKKEEVAKFRKGNNLGKATETTLSAAAMARKKSNMLLVLDEVLDRKQ